MLSRDEIMDCMQKQIKSFKTENLWEDTQKTLLAGEIFRQVSSVNNFGQYYYYISNYGRVMVVKGDKEKLENQKEIANNDELKQYNCWIIPVVNGFLKECSIDGIAVTTTTNVYEFMIKAGWLNDGEDKKLAQEIVKHNIDSNYYPNDRIEVHHIDNNPSNNSLENLIWVPRSIHQTLPKK